MSIASGDLFALHLSFRNAFGTNNDHELIRITGWRRVTGSTVGRIARRRWMMIARTTGRRIRARRRIRAYSIKYCVVLCKSYETRIPLRCRAVCCFA